MITTYKLLHRWSGLLFRRYVPIEHRLRSTKSYGPKISRRLDWIYSWHQNVPATYEMPPIEIAHLQFGHPSRKTDRAWHWIYRRGLFGPKFIIEHGPTYMQIWVSGGISPAECRDIVNVIYLKLRLSVLVTKGL